jgi:hypothetical protein
MDTPYRKDCSQGTAHVLKDLFSFQKLVFKYPTWEFTADAYVLKPQRLQNKVLRAI